MREAAEKIPYELAATRRVVPIHCRPFLKWVGGKTQLLPALLTRIPDFKGRYFEPFIGGGALFFNYQPRRGYISDINPELINAYQVVKSDVEALIRSLKKHVYDKEYYYRLREQDGYAAYKRWSPVRRASRLIYLNRTCFNGLYRVNSSGRFNTPFGRYTNPRILNAENLRACSKALARTSIRLAPFSEIESRVGSNDFVYFDPPYVPLSTTASFTGYAAEGFDLDMQVELFELCKRLDRKGVRFMLSNSSAPFVINLYREFNIARIPASRAINSNAARRGKVDEVVVTNY